MLQKKKTLSGRMVETILREFKTIDILVNNVGTFIGGPFLEFSIDDWHKISDYITGQVIFVDGGFSAQ